MSLPSAIKCLGDIVGKNIGGNSKVELLCGEGKVIGLYFSALWCPSCRAFTLDLVKFYKNIKTAERKDTFEVIFISSDTDECHFADYFKTMPWFALPFNDRDRQLSLTRKFHVHSIPMLILIDGKSGEVITPHGRECVIDDPQGLGFPWKLRNPIEVLQEASFVSSQGEQTEFNSLSSYIKGLYFSAHWCPPCKAFTPVLIKLYKKLQETGQKFQVIFISSDRSSQSFEQYFSSMPWLAIPYVEEKRRKELALLYGVGGIPTLVILDEDNNIITKDGRTEVNEDPEGEDFPWRPKLVDELAEKHIAKLNEEPCLILFTGYEEKELEAAHYILLPVAEEYQARAQRALAEETTIPMLNFFYAGDAEICDSVRDFVQLSDHVPLLVILDIPNGKKYIFEGSTEISTEAVRRFVRDFLATKLTPYPVQT